MDKQSFPILDQDRWAISAADIEGRIGGILDSAVFSFPAESPKVATARFGAPKTNKPISSMMDPNAWTIDAEDTIEKVEEILSRQSSSAVPVMGSNGAIVGIIGPQELAQFL